MSFVFYARKEYPKFDLFSGFNKLHDLHDGLACNKKRPLSVYNLICVLCLQEFFDYNAFSSTTIIATCVDLIYHNVV